MWVNTNSVVTSQCFINIKHFEINRLFLELRLSVLLLVGFSPSLLPLVSWPQPPPLSSVKNSHALFSTEILTMIWKTFYPDAVLCIYAGVEPALYTDLWLECDL